MQELQAIKTDLLALRRELIDYITEDDYAQDLMEKFMDVRDHNPEVYELLVLIYSEFKTDRTLSKKKTTHLINRTIDIKIKTIDNLIIEKTKRDRAKPWYLKTPSWGDIWKAIATAAVILIFIAGLYKWAPVAMGSFTDDTSHIIDSVKGKKGK